MISIDQLAVKVEKLEHENAALKAEIAETVQAGAYDQILLLKRFVVRTLHYNEKQERDRKERDDIAAGAATKPETKE